MRRREKEGQVVMRGDTRKMAGIKLRRDFGYVVG